MLKLERIPLPEYKKFIEDDGGEFNEKFPLPRDDKKVVQYKVFLDGEFIGVTSHIVPNGKIETSIQTYVFKEYRGKKGVKLFKEKIIYFENIGKTYRVNVLKKLLKIYDSFKDVDYKILRNEEEEDFLIIEPFISR